MKRMIVGFDEKSVKILKNEKDKGIPYSATVRKALDAYAKQVSQ